MHAHRAFYPTASFEEATRSADGAISRRSWEQLASTLEGAVAAPAHEGGVSIRGAQLLDTLPKQGDLSVFFLENHNSVRLGNWYTRSVLTLQPDQDHEFLIAAARRSERGEGSDPPLRVLQAPFQSLRGQLTSVVWA